MPYLIGTDEAGYGPNLGPLVVTGTLWKVPDVQADLYRLLAEVIASTRSSSHISVCDSKSLYSSSGTILALEQSVLSLVAPKVNDWRALVRLLGCGREANERERWLVDAPCPLPLLADTDTIKSLSKRFESKCESVGVQLVEVKTATVFPTDFNREVEAQGNKANLLSSTTLGIVSELIGTAIACDSSSSPRHSIRIVCDKHGGRSRYASLIQEFLNVDHVQVHDETRATSRYTATSSNCDMQIEFNAQGEGAMPVALASMVSKYVREIYMKLWNGYWAKHVPNIKPTKGYPQDAKRFMAEIESYCQKLNFDKETIWRNR